MSRHFILAMISFLLAMPAASLKPEVVAAAIDCLPFDSKCLEEQAECDYWDPLCKDDLDDCPSWDQSCTFNESVDNLEECPLFDPSCRESKEASTSMSTSNSREIKYTQPVNCALVLEGTFGGYSGYRDGSSSANLRHCVVSESRFSDDNSMAFLCVKGKPDLMAHASQDEVSVTDLGMIPSLEDPFWILCDEETSNNMSNMQCYDTDYSDADDWRSDCRKDKRADTINDNGRDLVWYACG